MNQGLHFSIHNELMLHGLSKMQALFPYQSTLLIIACGDHITLRCIDARCMLECKIPAQIISAGTCVVAMGTLYDLMRTELPDTIVVSVSHRPSVDRHHERHLELLGEGGWRLGRTERAPAS